MGKKFSYMCTNMAKDRTTKHLAEADTPSNMKTLTLNSRTHPEL